MNLNQLIRENLKKFSGYEPGEQPSTEGWVKLNTNENPFPPLPEIMEEIKGAIDDRLRKYPDPTALEVRKAILNQLLRDTNTLTNRNTVFVGNGCDEILDTIFKLFIDPGDQVVYFYPSYGYYKVLAEQYNAKSKEIKLNDDFSISESAFTAKGKLLFINSPNNPNGKAYENEIIEKIANSFEGIVVVDETYADFAGKTSLPLLKKLKNLIVCRSFSKSYSLASLRFGFAMADSDIIKEMNKVKLPYNTNYLAQIAALACIKYRKEIAERNKKVISERERLAEELNKYDGIEVLPSDANFFLMKFNDKSKCLKIVWAFKDKKILVRHWNKPGLYQYIRVSVGTEEENNKFLEEFKEIAEQNL